MAKSNRFGALSAPLKAAAQQTMKTPAAGKETPPKRKGRAKGKRSDPNTKQVGAYIPKDLDKEVKKLLLDCEGMDFSDLVTQLLEGWVADNKV